MLINSLCTYLYLYFLAHDIVQFTISQTFRPQEVIENKWCFKQKGEKCFHLIKGKKDFERELQILLT